MLPAFANPILHVDLVRLITRKRGDQALKGAARHERRPFVGVQEVLFASATTDEEGRWRCSESKDEWKRFCVLRTCACLCLCLCLCPGLCMCYGSRGSQGVELMNHRSKRSDTGTGSNQQERLQGMRAQADAAATAPDRHFVYNTPRTHCESCC